MLETLIGALVMIPIVTYYLDPKDFGIAAVIGMIIAWIIPLCSAGRLWVLSAHFYKIDDEEKKILFFNLLLVTVIISLFWYAVALSVINTVLPKIMREYRPEYLGYFSLALATMIFGEIWPVISLIIVFKKESQAHAIFETGRLFVGWAATLVCLVLLNMKTMALFLSPLISMAFVSLAGLWYLRKEIMPRLSRRWLKEIFELALPSVPYNLFEAVAASTDRFFIQRWLSLSDLGIYSHSKNYQRVFFLGTKAFTKTFAPDALENFSNNDNLDNMKHLFVLWYGFLAVAGICLALFSYDFVSFITHGKFAAAGLLVPLWFIFAFSLSFGLPYLQYLSVHKKNIFLLYSSIIINGLFIGVGALLIFRFGMIGAVSAAVGSNVAIQVVNRIYARRWGCKSVAEREGIVAALLVLILYMANTALRLDIAARLAIAVVLSAIVARHYGITSIALSLGRDGYHRLKDYLAARLPTIYTNLRREYYWFKTKRHVRGKVDPKTIMLADYPRCGISWIRYLLATTLHYRTSGEVRKLSLKEVYAYVPTLVGDEKDKRFYFNGENSLLRTHHRYYDKFKQAIVIYRDPYTTLRSHFTHLVMEGEKIGYNALRGLSIEETFLKMEAREFLIYYESWIRQVIARPDSFLLIKYEDLLAHTEPIFKKMLSFVKIDDTAMSPDVISEIAGMYHKTDITVPLVGKKNPDEAFQMKYDMFTRITPIMSQAVLRRIAPRLERELGNLLEHLDSAREKVA